MTHLDFEGADLWVRTLAERPDDPHKMPRERLRNAYRGFRDNAALLLAENARHTPDFTVHDVSHSDALWEMASYVCGEEISLNPAEAFVLGCTFLIHDSAMGLAAFDGDVTSRLGKGEWRDMVALEHLARFNKRPTAEEIERPDASVAAACTAKAIRVKHAESARILVEKEIRTDSGTRHLLTDDDLRSAYGRLIGEIAASHGAPVDSLINLRGPRSLIHGIPSDWSIDPLKLACLLRLADAIHVDRSRAPELLHVWRSPRRDAELHWRFQERLNRPIPTGDRIQYDAARGFSVADAEVWWFALDYLRSIDSELQRVDSFLFDTGEPRMAVRAVAGVDTPERFGQLFTVDGWRPIDASIKVSDIPRLADSLGGRQLYGNLPEVALRELIQNAQDALRARLEAEPGCAVGQIDIRLKKDGESWVLEVQDNGIGMTEGIVSNVLLDFGATGWKSHHVTAEIPGLISSGFEPAGQFGIGFYSVFMLGSKVEVITRSWDAALRDGLRLTFNGMQERALLAPLDQPAPIGTTVRVELEIDPYKQGGIFWNIYPETLSRLVRHLCLENEFEIRTTVPTKAEVDIIRPFSLAMGTPAEVFDRTYPPEDDRWDASTEEKRQRTRSWFIEHASEVIAIDGRRVGLAALAPKTGFQDTDKAVLTVGGFRADSAYLFLGYLAGAAGRAARDAVDVFADANLIRSWMNWQVQHLRSRGEYSERLQLDLGGILWAMNGVLGEDDSVALTGAGELHFGDVGEWITSRDEIFVVHNGFNFIGRSPGFYDEDSMERVTVPDNWVTINDTWITGIFHEMFGKPQERMPLPSSVSGEIWEWVWRRFDTGLGRFLLESICEAWSCDALDLLAPVVERGKADRRQPGGSDSTFSGTLLHRPREARPT
ncbi:ATP-binding protein [Promicromonospora sukumoe]|uniref:HD domain-containing protein n=1 Tax=Promicromonospora sukumoe TaxID=88382 RepID=UPI0036506BC6